MNSRSAAGTARARLTALASRLDVSRALVFSVLGRTWSVLAGPITLLCIARFMSREEQGFYYTFWSVLGLWVFFDLGLGLVMVQFASHERVGLRLVDGRMVGDERALQRLSSLFHIAMRWYGAAGVLMLVGVMPAGIAFFYRYQGGATHVKWLLPWILVAVTSTMNMLVGPLSSILEGSGLLHDVALMRLLQALVANGCLWLALAGGAGLYSAVVLNGAMALFSSGWMYVRHRRFFVHLATIPGGSGGIDFRREIWPFQWRFAVSWMTGYFMFQILNPILFARAGAVVAGQMGMSLMITTAIALFAQAWITTRGVDYGAYVAARDFDTLERTFRATVLQSSFVMVALSAVVMAGVGVLRHFDHPLALRVLPPVPFALLLIATILNHIVSVEASYLRAFKREPFLGVFASMFALSTAGGILVARTYGSLGMTAILLVSVATIGVCGGTFIFVTKRRQWLSEPIAAEHLLSP